MANEESGLPERHGLFTIHPEWYEPSSCDVDIVAVHGLNGHPFKTWTDRDGHMWLRDSLPHHVSNARIMSFGYDSALRNTKSKMTLNHFAQDLLWRLSRERQECQEERRPLVFICHSLGGIVVKQALVMAVLSGDEYAEISKSISAIAFFGTPHRGSRSASPARILSSIFNAASFSHNVRSDLLELLEVESSILDSASILSRKPLSNISIVSFYEQQPHSVTGKLIVEPFSAVLGIPNERAIPINADHRGITRLSPRHPQRYFPVWVSIKELVEKSLLESRYEYDEMMNNIFCVDYKTAQLRPRQPHPGTCNWIFGNNIYRLWYSSLKSDTLLLTAPAGFGKTVLTRYLTEQVMAGQQAETRGYSTPVAVSFFCSYNDQNANSVQVVLRSLLHQLLQLNPRAQSIVRGTIIERMRFGGFSYELEAKRIWKAIQDVLSMNGMENILISIDALEELGSDEAFHILQGFSGIQEHLNANHPHSRAKFFFSSRPRDGYEENFPKMHVLSISHTDVESDIRHYLSDRINEYGKDEPAFANAISSSGRTSEEIVSRITLRADGMFLWACLAWDNFTHGFMWNGEIIEQRLEELNSLPEGINPLYQKTLSRVDPGLSEDMWVFSSILAVTKEPLNELQLSRLLAVSKSRSKSTFHPKQIQPVGGLMRNIKKNFADLFELQNDNTILFTHLSFKEYLLDTWKHEKPEIIGRAEATFARACLSYIMHWDTLEPQETDENCLRRYADQFHLHHLAALPSRHSLWIAFSDTSGSGYFNGSSKSPISNMLLQSFLLDNLMSVKKVHNLIQRFVAHGYSLDNSESPKKQGAILNDCCEHGSVTGSSPERKRSAYYYRKTIELLLELGANPNLYPLGGRPNLVEALRGGGGRPVLDALLNHPKFDLKRMDSNGQTALHILVEMGSDKRTLEVLDKDVDVNIQDNSGSTALHSAVALSRDQIVRKLLLMPDTRTDLVDNSGRTPLTLATWWGLKQIALLFIQQPSEYRNTKDDPVALMNAARHGEQSVTDLLLVAMKYKNTNNVIDDSGKRFLHHAAMNNWSEQSEKCLKSGDHINLDDIDNSGKTALHYAAKLGCTETCHVLLLFGAKANIQDRNGMNAVQLAADAGYKDTLMALLTTGRFDANQRDHQGRNLVHWSATLDCLDVMDLVCQQPGAELARRDNSGKMPIDYAWSCQCPQVGRYLSHRMQCMPLEVPWIDVYSWEGVYAVAAKKVANNSNQDELVQKAKDREELERREEALRYPAGQWALAVAGGNFFDREKKDEKKDEKRDDGGMEECMEGETWSEERRETPKKNRVKIRKYVPP